MIIQGTRPPQNAWKGFGLICFLCYAGMLYGHLEVSAATPDTLVFVYTLPGKEQ